MALTPPQGNVYNCGMTYVIRVSDNDERSALTAKVLLIFYMGMLFGPALNYPLSLLGRYQFGLFSIESLNAPGFLMVLTLSIAVALLHLWFEEPINVAEFEAADTSAESRKCCGLGKYRPLFTSFTLMAVIVLQFVVQFNQIVIETIVTPVTFMYYDFGQLENSLVYAAITLVFFLWFGTIIVVSKRLQDRTLVAVGTLFFGLCFVTAVSVFYSQPHPDTYPLPFYVFCLLVVSLVSGIPFFLSSMSSLFSKLVGDPRIQGMGQSLMNASTSMANIAGPILSGLILPRVDVVFAMLLGGWAVTVLILALRWRVFETASLPPQALSEVIAADDGSIQETNPQSAK